MNSSPCNYVVSFPLLSCLNQLHLLRSLLGWLSPLYFLNILSWTRIWLFCYLNVMMEWVKWCWWYQPTLKQINFTLSSSVFPFHSRISSYKLCSLPLVTFMKHDKWSLCVTACFYINIYTHTYIAIHFSVYKSVII